MPIIMFGDAWDPERILDSCRETGLAGYLPKPISIARLVSSIHDHIHRPQPGAPPTMPQPPAFEVERLTSFTDGDHQLERELTSLYLATAGCISTRCAAPRRRRRLGQAAHALKGASANIGAAAVARLAEEAEQAGRLMTGWRGSMRRWRRAHLPAAAGGRHGGTRPVLRTG